MALKTRPCCAVNAQHVGKMLEAREYQLEALESVKQARAEGKPLVQLEDHTTLERFLTELTTSPFSTRPSSPSFSTASTGTRFNVFKAKRRANLVFYFSA